MVIYTDGCIYNHATYMGLYDHETTKHFLGEILYFKGNRYLQQPLNMFPNMK